jgi:CheY-like chemotaxis protein
MLGQACEYADVLGDVGYLQKPIDVDELLAAVERFTTGPKPSILLVSGQPGLRRLLEGALRRAGFIVRPVGTGPEALQFYRRHGKSIDLVLLDVTVPRQTVTALRKLNSDLRCCFLGRHASKNGRGNAAVPGAIFFPEPAQRLEEMTQTLWRLVHP